MVDKEMQEFIDDYMGNHDATPNGWLWGEIVEAIEYGYNAACLNMEVKIKAGEIPAK